MSRFRQFETEEDPLVESHEPDSADLFKGMDMAKALLDFPKVREDMVAHLRSYEEDYWELSGRHEAFSPYNTRILLMHTLNVDYAHLFSIEQLGLTKPGLETEIISIP
jgi:hypothetical protein